MTLLSSLFGAQAQQSDNIKILSAPEFKDAIANNEVQLVDVRTPQEYMQGAIDGAVNIDFFQQTLFTEKFSKLNKEKPVYIYCRSGSRSFSAAQKLVAMGFTQVYDLNGGYMRWPY